MKIYTQTYDLTKTSPQRFWVTPFSDFKIGIKLLSKGELANKDFTLKAGAIELTPDEAKIDGFTIFTIKSGNTGFVDYTIEVAGIAEKLKLTQIVTDSTVFDIGVAGGNVPSDVATQSWVENYVTAETSTFIDETALNAATSDKVTGSAIGSAPVVTNAVAVYASVWASMSASANANTLYVVLSDPS